VPEQPHAADPIQPAHTEPSAVLDPATVRAAIWDAVRTCTDPVYRGDPPLTPAPIIYAARTALQGRFPDLTGAVLGSAVHRELVAVLRELGRLQGPDNRGQLIADLMEENRQLKEAAGRLEDRETQETQETVGRWADDSFGRPANGIGGRILKLIEEASEAAAAHGHSREEIRLAVDSGFPKDIPPGGRRSDLGKLPEELSDVDIVLDTIFHSSGIDRQAVKDRKMTRNRARVWGKTLDGCGQHTKEAEL
jgi:hypothetical protein